MSIRNFQNWFRAMRAQSEHEQNSMRAEIALVHAPNGALIKKHLHRIAVREELLSQFAGHVADSPALDVDDGFHWIG